MQDGACIGFLVGPDREFALFGPSAAIGRSAVGTQAQLESESVASKHAVVDFGPGAREAFITGKGPTLLNGNPVEERARLTSGDVLRFGTDPTVYRFYFVADLGQESVRGRPGPRQATAPAPAVSPPRRPEREAWPVSVPDWGPGFARRGEVRAKLGRSLQNLYGEAAGRRPRSADNRPRPPPSPSAPAAPSTPQPPAPKPVPPPVPLVRPATAPAKPRQHAPTKSPPPPAAPQAPPVPAPRTPPAAPAPRPASAPRPAAAPEGTREAEAALLGVATAAREVAASQAALIERGRRIARLLAGELPEHAPPQPLRASSPSPPPLRASSRSRSPLRASSRSPPPPAAPDASSPKSERVGHRHCIPPPEDVTIRKEKPRPASPIRLRSMPLTLYGEGPDLPKEHVWDVQRELDSAVPGPPQGARVYRGRAQIEREAWFGVAREAAAAYGPWRAKDTSAPDRELVPEWVYGYRGMDGHNNARFVAPLGATDAYDAHVAGRRRRAGATAGVLRAAWPAGALAVVYDPADHSQRFFTGHAAAVLCLAVSHDGRLVATGDAAGKAYVWEADTQRPLGSVHVGDPAGLPPEDAAACANAACCAVALSKNGATLATASFRPPAGNRVRVWDWATGACLHTLPLPADKIFGLEFSWYGAGHEQALAACGPGGLLLFTLSVSERYCRPEALTYGPHPACSVYAIAFLAYGTLVAGASDGHLYRWRRGACAGPVTIEPAHRGSVLSVQADAGVCVSGGADGVVRWWDRSFAPLRSLDLAAACARLDAHGLPSTSAAAYAPRALCAAPHGTLVGTSSNQLYEVDGAGTVGLLARGHGPAAGERRDGELAAVGPTCAGAVWGVSEHGRVPMFVSVGSDGYLTVYRMDERRVTNARRFPHPPRSVAVSPDEHQQLICMGLESGEIVILDAVTLTEKVRVHISEGAVTALSYSPDGRWLAAGGYEDGFHVLYLHDVSRAYLRTGALKGHHGPVTEIDWSGDSRYVQTNAPAARELRFWDADAVKTLLPHELPRGILWPSSSCLLSAQVQGASLAAEALGDPRCLCVSHSGELLVSAHEGSPALQLWRHPAWDARGVRRRAGAGHSGAVRRVRFASSDDLVISAADDLAVIQWRVAPVVIPGRSRERPPYAIAPGSEREAAAAARAALADRLAPPEVLSPAYAPPSAPAADLRLAYVHGLRTYDRGECLHAVSGPGVPPPPPGETRDTREVLTWASALAVLHAPGTGEQRFFARHDDLVTCGAVNGRGDLAATGQLGPAGTVYVWEVATLTVRATLEGFHRGGVSALCFSPVEEGVLATLGVDAAHTVALWRWTLDAAAPWLTVAVSPRPVHVLKFAPDGRLFTAGAGHATWWRATAAGLDATAAHMPSALALLEKRREGPARLPTILCAAFVPELEATVTGTREGDLLVWRNAAAAGLVGDAPTRVHVGGVYALHFDGEGLTSGGADGRVRRWTPDLRARRGWDVVRLVWDGAVEGLPEITGRGAAAQVPSEALGIRSLAALPAGPRGGRAMLAATRGGFLVALAPRAAPRLLLAAHGPAADFRGSARLAVPGRVRAIAPHPAAPDRLLTVADDRTVRLWAEGGRRCVRVRYLYPAAPEHLEAAAARGAEASGRTPPPLASGPCPACATWAPDGAAAAVGCEDGTVFFLREDLGDAAECNVACVRAGDGATACGFSPDGGRLLAVGRASGAVHVYNAARGFAAAGFLKEGHAAAGFLRGGHRAPIVALDWALDGRHFRTMCAEGRLVHWDVRRFERVIEGLEEGRRPAGAPLPAAERAALERVRELRWATCTAVAAWDAAGALPPGRDTPFAAAVDRRPGPAPLLAAARPDGLALLPYPCPRAAHGAARRAFALPQALARFAADGARLLSAGDEEPALLSWALPAPRPLSA